VAAEIMKNARASFVCWFSKFTATASSSQIANQKNA
jgi:hypothetical protein